uniref:Uncharacterized protein n=1 Tax=Stomoxys calcitrans TaxID=35570 RepID=A0A1I8P1E3_STOCA
MLNFSRLKMEIEPLARRLPATTSTSKKACGAAITVAALKNSNSQLLATHNPRHRQQQQHQHHRQRHNRNHGGGSCHNRMQPSMTKACTTNCGGMLLQVFLILTLFVIGNLSAWQENIRPKLYVELGKSNYN